MKQLQAGGKEPMGKKRWGRGLAILGILFSVLAAGSRPAEASHAQGYPCYQCHSLKPGDVRPGSKAILLTQTILGTIPPNPPTTTTRPMPGTGGWPVSCDLCHSAATDVPKRSFAKTSRHPVDVIGVGSDNTTNTHEITCNDCHAGKNGGAFLDNSDLTPQSLTVYGGSAKGYGYPDHFNVTAGYTHTLAANPPHLTQPYWLGTSLPGSSAANDTAFWTSVRNNTLAGGTDAMICWVCHSTSASPFTGVTSSKNIKNDYTGTGSTKGHQINTAGGRLSPGTALPCYDCHDSHGSASASLVLDNQSIYGSANSMLAVTTYTGANDLAVCSQCHDTRNDITRTTLAGGVGKMVEGLYPVDPYDSLNDNAVHRSSGIADVMTASTKSCLAANGGCHATPHNPIGESKGGQNCGLCHSATYNAMKAGSTTGYHHAMMGDNALATYPTTAQPTVSDSGRTCLICHVDHNYFSKIVDPTHTRAQNLRNTIGVQPDNGANAPVRTDYNPGLPNGGICTSCHNLTQTKSTGNIKPDGVPTTAVVDNTRYGASAHAYPSVSPFIQGHFSSDNLDANNYFQANCTKCHNDTAGTSFQGGGTTADQFALHESTANNLLAPLGIATPVDNLGAGFCYRCHSKTTDAIGGTIRKTVNLRDVYNNTPMDNASESIFRAFNRTSKHPLAQVDCLSCHNVHTTRSATNSVVANPDNTYAFMPFNPADNAQPSVTSRSGFCLACHDGSGTTAVISAIAYVPKAITISAFMNKGTNGARGHWTVGGSLTSTSVKACDHCHDKHGSTAAKLLGVLDNNDGVNKINGVAVSATVTAADNAAICNACHTPVGLNYPPTTVSLASISTQESYRDGTGYFGAAPAGSVIRWPGKAVWDNGVYSPHGTSAKTGPAVLGSRGVIDCNGCHDPHGTAYSYNMLTDNMAAGNYRLCFDCHGASGPAVDNVAAYYPVASGGTGAAAGPSVHTGHNIKTPLGKLPQYTALPCYDCHVTHGSRNLNTQLKSDQRWSGLGNTWGYSNASNNRRFCLGCHVTTNNLDGSGALVAGTDNVEGLSRLGVNKLRLPTTNPLVEHASASTQGCGSCHSGRNYNDNSYGPHNPATGKCDLCHESQGALSGGVASFNGAHRTHSDNTGYRFACKQCHSWTATGTPAVHKNDTAANYYAEVVFDNQATAGWLTDTGYGTPAVYEYRSLFANPYGASAPGPTYVTGADNGTADLRQASVRWTNGTCGAVWCHSNANPVTLTQGVGDVAPVNVYQSAAWIDNSLSANCTGCHGGDATSGRTIGDNTAPTKGSVVHRKHINANLGCYKCHSFTVTTSNNRLVNAIDNHVNGIKEVKFSAEVGGSYDNTNKTCNSTSCHGVSLPLADWDNTATVSGCAACHSSMGPGNTYVFTGAHRTHTDNGLAGSVAGYKTACEACHANRSSIAGGNAVHAGGDNNTGTSQFADIFFSDNGSSQSYNGKVYTSANLFGTTFGLSGGPSYTAAGVSAGTDPGNTNITWTAGTCTTVWCHSNANPLTATGGVRANSYRFPTWTTAAQPCTYCHSGSGTWAAMNLGTDNLSYAHLQHVATDNGYSMTCDKCHTWTGALDNNLGLKGQTGFDNHVNGIKTVKFGTTIRTGITIDNQANGYYDNAAPYQCSNTYCHSNGMDNVTIAANKSPRWDNVNIPGCTYCHGGGANTTNPIMTQAHDNHVNNAVVLGINYTCKRCHNATISNTDNVTLASRVLHVNGYKNVAFDNGGSYVNATKTCSNTLCHQQGNAALPAGAGADNIAVRWDNTVNTGCRRCHGSITGGAVAGYTSSSNFGEPNYDNGISGVSSATQNSHAKHVSVEADCKDCHRNTVTGTRIDNAAYAAEHINDNVEVFAGPGVSFGWTQATHTCSAISCHGGNAATWGQSLTCFSCHSGTEQLYKPQPSPGTPNPVDNAPYLSRGHGRTAGSYPNTLNPPASFDNTSPVADCYYCHSQGAAHTTKDGNDPYRLGQAADAVRQKTGGAVGSWADNTDGLCLKCHGSAADRTGISAAATQAVNKQTHSKAIAGTMIGVWTITPWKCVDCHDPHGDASNAMIRSGINAPTSVGDNTASGAGSDSYGSPRRTTNISSVLFTDNTGYAANSYAVPGVGSPYGICEVCHVQTSAFSRTADATPAHASTAYCIGCHGHGVGFKGTGGSNQEQFFDGGYRTGSTSNYRDLSGHRLRTDNVLDTVGQIDCYQCHGVDATNRVQNECFKCHYENRTGLPVSHPNGVFEWATPSSPGTPLATFISGSVDVNDTLCLACHGLAGGASGTALNTATPVAAPNILPTTTESWTGGSGHGAISSLSTNFAGPPAYHCADCHKSTAFQTGGTARDQTPGGVHGSINRKLVRHDNGATGGQEYPAPTDNIYTTVGQRSARMDSYCAGKCHGVAGGQAKDDNVADHAWDLLGGGSRTATGSHPSNMSSAPAVLFRAPDNLPLSEYLSGALPGTGNEVCITCHNPHGGGNLVDKTGSTLSGGAKQMVRRSFSDNTSTLCKECHL